jgi:hypothetical protein
MVGMAARKDHVSTSAIARLRAGYMVVPTNVSLAALYGVSDVVISLIRRNKLWKHVTWLANAAAVGQPMS